MPTSSLDFRRRAGGDARAVDQAEFFGRELPELCRRNGPLVLPGARDLNPRCLAIDVGGDHWTLALGSDGIVVTAGDLGAEAVVVLDDEGLADLVNDVRTPMGFFTGGALNMPKGRLEDFLDWSVILRGLVDGVAVHTTGAITFRDRDGEPLELSRSFQPDDDPEDMAHFLSEAGFLHLAQVFTAEEMAAVSSDIDAALPLYEPDDGRSWWARTAGGEHRAVRLQYFQDRSETTTALLGDDRYLRIGRLTSDGHRAADPCAGGNAIEALIKPIGVVEGISDLPWHKDCSLGGHSYRCCSLIAGISVTGADASSGQLRVVAGSHRALVQPAFVRRNLDLPQVDLPTQAGDVTVHLTCTLHMSQAPISAERRVMYTSFGLPDGGGLAAGDAAKLSRIREGSYKTVSQPPSPVG